MDGGSVGGCWSTKDGRVAGSSGGGQWDSYWVEENGWAVRSGGGTKAGGAIERRLKGWKFESTRTAL
ncbi:unnamed protein product [Dovyalis caffra]|uniref:Uncharacterized protein n=1 Tax=Dovyalis caffra TaxID=77055 RepID=A0AAV1S8R1_9ROSI|nr:unnamed protein product [Dovyalis caffra]